MIESYWNGKVFLASERKYTNTNVYVATIGTCLSDPLQERLTQVHSHLPVPASTPLEHYHIGALKLSFPVLFPDSHWPILVGCSTTLIALWVWGCPTSFPETLFNSFSIWDSSCPVLFVSPLLITAPLLAPKSKGSSCLLLFPPLCHSWVFSQ